ncbi:Hypothetical predicted protein [Cloeon dipterum]|uniref:Uncharacterized protein n=1 Tax=Cloeon dipterum TaxID=197152 RepID=A0A8S1CE02_9INSE|nr:Hypothetical predicted protein [Cloeon dipterum]
MFFKALVLFLFATSLKAQAFALDLGRSANGGGPQHDSDSLGQRVAPPTRTFIPNLFAGYFNPPKTRLHGWRANLLRTQNQILELQMKQLDDKQQQRQNQNLHKPKHSNDNHPNHKPNHHTPNHNHRNDNDNHKATNCTQQPPNLTTVTTPATAIQTA